jgi:hypothetical protein
MDTKERKDSPQRHRVRLTGEVLEGSGFSVPLWSIIRVHSWFLSFIRVNLCSSAVVVFLVGLRMALRAM